MGSGEVGELIKIPRGFYDDHADRELPSPVIIKETKRNYVISRDDPAWEELLSDAQHYANDGCDCGPVLVFMARSLVRAMA